MTDRRYYVRSPDGGMVAGYDDPNAAKAVALDYGHGAHLVDTHAQAYHPIAQVVADGELVFVDIGGWGAGADAKDAKGGPALLWAVAGGKAEIVELLIAHGADINARDGDRTGALDLARNRDKPALIQLLQRTGS